MKVETRCEYQKSSKCWF